MGADAVTLRPFRSADAPRLAACLADTAVSRWLTGVPEPYGLGDAEAWLQRDEARAGVAHAIEVGGDLVGCVSLRPGRGLGYWVARSHWGRGLVRAAVRIVLDRHFQHGDLPVLSGHNPGNDRSRAVLLSFGFRDVGQIEVSSAKAAGRATVLRMQLTRPNWAFARDPRIETRRLILRPMGPADAEAISALGNDEGIARMLLSVPHPFSPEDARAWMGDNRWRGRPGFRWAIALRDGPVIGMAALGPGGCSAAGRDAGLPSCSYWLGRAHWGQGYATEAMRAFLGDLIPRLDLGALSAEAYQENPGSVRVLEKLGFRRTGEDMGTSAARADPAPVYVFRLEEGGLRR